MKGLNLLVLLLFLAPSPAASQVPDDKLIVPGQRIGKWTLDMTSDALRQVNGSENIAPGSPGTPIERMRGWFADSNGEIWWHEWSNLYFSVATRGRDAQRVEYLFTWSGDFKTDKGVAPGMLRLAVENAHGQPTGVTRAGGGQVPGGLRLIYDEIGLAAPSRAEMVRWKCCLSFIRRPPERSGTSNHTANTLLPPTAVNGERGCRLTRRAPH